MIFLFILKIIGAFVRYIQNRNGDIIFSNKIQRKTCATLWVLSSFSWILIIGDIFKVKFFKWILFLNDKIIIILKSRYFCLIFLADSLEIFSYTLSRIIKNIFILFTKLMNNWYIISTCLIFIINLCVWIISIFNWFKIFIVKNLMQDWQDSQKVIKHYLNTIITWRVLILF